MKTYSLESQGLSLLDTPCHFDPAIDYLIFLSPEELLEWQFPFPIHPKTLEACLSEVNFPRLEVYENYDFGLLHTFLKGSQHLQSYRMHFYLSDHFLICISKPPFPWLETFESNLLQAPCETYSPDKILYLLMDQLMSEDHQLLNKLENQINLLEESVLKGEKKDYIQAIIKLKKSLLYLKRYYEPLIDITTTLLENDNEILAPKMLRYFRILSQRIIRLNSQVLHLQENVNQIREAYDSQVDIRLNKIMKVFTMITVIFSPLTLIVGWYGMNFEFIPELEWSYGYPYVIFLCLSTIIGSLIYFKKRHWF